MSIEKLPHHYSFTAPASVYDEESATALEMVGRQGAKINELIGNVNSLESRVFDSVEKAVVKEVADHITGGTFDDAINEHMGNLEARVDNLVSGGSETKDAEVVDMRVNGAGLVFGSAGESTREQAKDAENNARAVMYLGAGATFEWGAASSPVGGAVIDFPGKLTLWAYRWTGDVDWGDIDESEKEKLSLTANADGSARIILPAYSSFVYNVYSRKFFMRSGCKGNVGDVLLLFNTHSRIAKGCLWDWYVWKKVGANTADIVVNHEEMKRAVAFSRAGYIYSGASNHVVFTPDYDNNTLKVYCPKPLARFTSGGSGSIPWADATSAIADNVAISGDGCTITVPNYKSLVFSETSDKFYIRNGGTINADDIPLVQNTYCFPLRGTLVDEWLSKGGSGNASTSSGTETAADIQTAYNAMSAAVAGMNGNHEKIMFFTDPHLCEGSSWFTEFANYKPQLKKAHEAFGADVVICGGDWLGNSDTAETARAKMVFANAQMRSIFGDKFLPVIGNHDTNYQGSATLSRAELAGIWGIPGGKCYYEHETEKAVYFIFDTWTDRNLDSAEATAYWAEQIAWFVGRINARKDAAVRKNAVIVMHQYWVEGSTMHPLATYLETPIAEAGRYSTNFPNIDGTSLRVEKGAGTPVCAIILAGHLHTAKSRDAYESGGEYFTRVLARPDLRSSNGNAEIDLIDADMTGSSGNIILNVTPYGGSTTTHTIPTGV